MVMCGVYRSGNNLVVLLLSLSWPAHMRSCLGFLFLYFSLCPSSPPPPVFTIEWRNQVADRKRRKCSCCCAVPLWELPSTTVKIYTQGTLSRRRKKTLGDCPLPSTSLVFTLISFFWKRRENPGNNLKQQWGLIIFFSFFCRWSHSPCPGFRLCLRDGIPVTASGRVPLPTAHGS